MTDEAKAEAFAELEPWYVLEEKRGVSLRLGKQAWNTWGLSIAEARDLGNALLSAADHLEGQAL